MNTPDTTVISTTDLTTLEGAASALDGVLNDIITNRAALAQQIANQEAQIEGGKSQLVKFDALIAALQVASADEKSLLAIVEQHAANSVVSTASSLADPAQAPSAPAAGAAPAEAPAAG